MWGNMIELDKEFETFMARLSLPKNVTPPDQWQMMKEAFMGGMSTLIAQMKESHIDKADADLTQWWEAVFKQLDEFWSAQRKKMN